MLDIYETALDVIGGLRPVIDAIARCDSDLARQLRRAAASVPLNISEGSYARGRNRKALYQVALGSAKEAKACIDVAVRFGYVTRIDAATFARLDSICAVLYRLVT